MTEPEIEAAIVAGPADTRGGIRGLCVGRFPDQIKSLQWERVEYAGGVPPRSLDMSDLFEPEEVKYLAEVLQKAASLADAASLWNQRKEGRS